MPDSEGVNDAQDGNPADRQPTNKNGHLVVVANLKAALVAEKKAAQFNAGNQAEGAAEDHGNIEKLGMAHAAHPHRNNINHRAAAAQTDGDYEERFIWKHGG